MHFVIMCQHRPVQRAALHDVRSVIGLCWVLKSVFSFTESHCVWRATCSPRQPLGRGSACRKAEGGHKHAEGKLGLYSRQVYKYSYTLVTGNTFCRHADSRGHGWGMEGARGVLQAQACHQEVAVSSPKWTESVNLGAGVGSLWCRNASLRADGQHRSGRRGG